MPNWHDLSPRVGLTYDLFGDGRTAVKVTLNRYVAGQGTGGVTSGSHPLTRSVLSVNRNWIDADGDFVPDCDLANPLLNGECAQISNLNFGQNNPNASSYDPQVLEGWGVRGYNWETSAALQRQLTATISVQVGYYRRWYWPLHRHGQPAGHPCRLRSVLHHYSDRPESARRGGQQQCGYYDVSPEKFGQVEEFITLGTKDFGYSTEVYDGVDVSMNARMPQGVTISGGVSLGRVATTNCQAVDSPEVELFCNVAPPFQPNIKLMGSNPLPVLGLQFAATLQNVPGAQITASYVARNIEIIPSLGRTLSSGPNGTKTLALIEPGTLFEDRQTQLDFRFAKRFTVGRYRILGNVDIFNVLNLAGIDAINTSYGPAWRTPTRIQGTRYVKFSAQLDF